MCSETVPRCSTVFYGSTFIHTRLVEHQQLPSTGPTKMVPSRVSGSTSRCWASGWPSTRQSWSQGGQENIFGDFPTLQFQAVENKLSLAQLSRGSWPQENMGILFLTLEENLRMIQPNNYDKRTYSGKCVELYRKRVDGCLMISGGMSISCLLLVEIAKFMNPKTQFRSQTTSGSFERKKASLGWPFLNSWYLERIHVCLYAWQKIAR